MSVERIAETYSSAIFELGQESGLLPQFDTDLSYVQDLFSTHEELRQILINPMLEVAGKKKILEQIFGSEVHPLIMNFLYVMVDRRRSPYIMETARAYVKRSRETRGILEAKVTVIEPLSETMREKVLKKLQDITGKECVIEEYVEPSILGGMVIQVGDTRIDGSMARRLEELKKSLLNASTNKIGVNG